MWPTLGARLIAILLPLFFAGAGCNLPAQMSFSPDGKHIAYRVDDQMHLLNESGKPLARLGRSIGGMAWSKDASTLYFVAASEPDLNPATRPATEPAEPNSTWMLYSVRPGEPPVPICKIDDPALYLQIDPSEQWLAILTRQEKGPNQLRVLAHRIGSASAIEVSRRCAAALCFTGDARLALVEQSIDDQRDSVGAIVEINLIESPDPLPRTPLLVVLCSTTPWLQPMGNDLLFTSISQSLPGLPREEASLDLFHYTRASKTLATLTKNVGPFFSISPDRKHILFEKVTPKTEESEAVHELAIVNSNGSDAHAIRDLGQYGQLPMWPAWRNAGEFAFVEPNGPERAKDATGRTHFDVMLYRVGGEGLMHVELVTKLSEGWPDAFKPFLKSESQPTTEPSTRPTSAPVE